MAGDGKHSGRDDQGRFAKGNPGGPGNPQARHATALRHAAQSAVSSDHMSALMRKALRMALEGNLQAMRIVFERTLGRPIEGPTETDPIDIEPPRMQTAAECNAAVEHIIDGVVKGTIDREAAKLMLAAIQTRVKTIEVTELEERLTEMEQALQTVSSTTPRRRK